MKGQYMLARQKLNPKIIYLILSNYNVVLTVSEI